MEAIGYDYDYDRQTEYVALIKDINDDIFAKSGVRPTMITNVYGCQQNEADGERIRGLLLAMGYGMAEDTQSADVVLLNTCAVREHAEKRVLGHVGAIKPIKKQILAVCGCMAQQKTMQDKIKHSYPQVNLMFGTSLMSRLPQMLHKVLTEGGRHFFLQDPTSPIEDRLPVFRNPPPRAWITVMTGCNNFCSYCIVPYVRGRERSRDSDAVLQEVREAIAAGYSEIFLLGQNVNSYNPDKGDIKDFPDLIKAINGISGDFTIKFMTSHPKDAGQKLLDTMASCEKVERTLHLPFQSGSDKILKAMNRKYDVRQYKELVAYARKVMPDIKLTSDVIVGFPGETDEDFEDTLSLMREVCFDGLYTFIYSRRTGTPAAEWQDDTPEQVKKQRFAKLLSLQKEVENR